MTRQTLGTPPSPSAVEILGTPDPASVHDNLGQLVAKLNANFTDLYAGTLGSNGVVVPYSGGGQTNATQLGGGLSQVSSSVATASPFDSVKLPASAIGARVVLINTSSNPIQVFGFGTDTINGVAAATGVTMAPNAVELFWCPVAGVWFADLGAGFSGSLFTELTQDSITAAGTSQGTAYQLYAQTNRITVASASAAPFNGVKLPASAPGLEVLIVNHGANPIQVYGSGSDLVNDQAAATGVSQMQGSFAIYSCPSAGVWYSEGLGTGYSGSLQTFSFQDAMSANSGGVQTGATAITTMIARFTTVGGAGYSAVLPTAAGGLNITVINAGANPMNVFPAGTATINGGAASAAFVLPAGAVVEFFTTVAGVWHTIYYNPNQVNHSYQTSSNTSSFTATAAQLVTGVIETALNLTGALGAAANITTPTAAQIVAAVPNAQVGNTFRVRIINSSTGAFAWTLLGGTNVAVNGTATINQNTWRDFIVSLTNVTSGSQAVTMTAIGTGTQS